MKAETLNNPPPDVQTIDRLSDLNEVNNRIQHHGWKLLGILYARDVDADGSFTDREKYIIGLPRERFA